MNAVNLKLYDFSGSWKRGREIIGHGKGRGVSSEYEPGDWVAVFGDNGIGKSTFLSALAGLTTFQHGIAKYRGEILKPHNAFQRFKLGFIYVSQETAFSEKISISNLKKVFFSKRKMIYNPELLEILWSQFFGHLQVKYDSDSDIPVRIQETLMAIASVPSILILDEIGPVFRANDISVSPYEAIKKLCPNSIVFVVDHDRQEAIKFCNKLIYFGDPVLQHGNSSPSSEALQPVCQVIEAIEKRDLLNILGNTTVVEEYLSGRSTFVINDDERVLTILLASLVASSISKRPSVLKALKNDFPWIKNDTATFGELSGGQKVVISALINKLVKGNNPPEAVLDHLSQSTRVNLKKYLVKFANG